MYRIFFLIFFPVLLSYIVVDVFAKNDVIQNTKKQSLSGTVELSKSGIKLETLRAIRTERKKKSKLLLKKVFDPPEIHRDESLLRFVSRDTALNNKTYKPEGLTSISGSYIHQAGRNSSLRYDAKIALDTLSKKFYEEFGIPLVVISGYRSSEYQQRLWDLGRCSDTHCAPPGNSEHQLGLAIDIFDATTAEEYIKNPRYKRYISWFQANAHLYGWHQSYQKGESIDGYMIEPWHWRYLGVDMATRLKNLGWTYTEYVKFNETMLGW